MRKSLVVLIGLIVASGLLLGPRPSEAVVNTCSVNGIYNLNGYGQNNTRIGGTVTFTQPGTCTLAGTFTSSITFKSDGGAESTLAVSGTYLVGSDTTTTITATSGAVATIGGLLLATR